MGIEVGGLLGLIWLVIVIWAIVKVAKSAAGGSPSCSGSWRCCSSRWPG